jgi:hypothetical protein
MYKFFTIYSVSEKTNKGRNFFLMHNNFLEDFYNAPDSEKELLIQKSPEDMSDNAFVPFLAATAHKLANDYNLSVPDWVFERRCFVPSAEPYFEAGVRGNLALWFMYTAPAEFKYRNIYVCGDVLTRV